MGFATVKDNPESGLNMSFTNQALVAEQLIKNDKHITTKTYPVPLTIDNEIAWLKLARMGVAIDTLTEEQKKHLASREIGT